MEAEDAKRLKEPESENNRLKRLLAEATMVSERRACRLAGLSRDAFRHPPEQAPATQALSARIIELRRCAASSAIAACTTCCVRSTRL